MNKENKQLLQLYQREHIRNIEESFVQLLSENEKVRLFFVNENRAFTDGKNIVVDPCFRELFCDVDALYKTECWMKIPHTISKDPWTGLHMVTRSQSIHEALHILYTRFPLLCNKDKRATSKLRLSILAIISNIIEDSFIESVGCSEYDNLELYLLFGRISSICANVVTEGTVSQVFGEIKNDCTEKTNPSTIYYLEQYLCYMGGFLLYPMLEQEEPEEEIKEYVELTKQLFLDGSICGDSKDRYEYTSKIFDIIESLIPNSEEEISTTILEKMIVGLQTHDIKNQTLANIENKPKKGNVNRRLTMDLKGRKIEGNGFDLQIENIMKQAHEEKEKLLVLVGKTGRIVNIQGDTYDCNSIHNNIQIIEKKPVINLDLKKAYEIMYKKYSTAISSYHLTFTKLLATSVETKERNKLYGSSLDSKRLGDIKKRYWYKNTTELLMPEIGVMLLIDGSGSMEGSLVEGARSSALILHEVLKKQNIEHAIVEHRAIYDEKIVHHNILVDYNARDEEKYNILTLTATHGTREGLSLYWAEKYMKKKVKADKKLIIVLSDGVPAHGLYGPECYIPPISIRDTADAVSKIRKRGTDIIAVALDDNGYSCYSQLKEIYPYVVACTDIKKLTGQLLEVIRRKLEGQ